MTVLSSVNTLNAVPLNSIQLSLTPLNTTPFKCISITNQKCEVRPQIVNVNSDEDFILLVLKKVNAVVVVTISMIHMQKYVFLML